MCCVGIYICVAWVYEDMCCVIVIIRVYMCVCVYECGYICCSSRCNMPQVSSHPDIHFLCHMFFSFSTGVDLTIGSALDIFGGNLSFDAVVQWQRQQEVSLCLCLYLYLCLCLCLGLCLCLCLGLSLSGVYKGTYNEKDRARQRQTGREVTRKTQNDERESERNNNLVNIFRVLPSVRTYTQIHIIY